MLTMGTTQLYNCMTLTLCIVLNYHMIVGLDLSDYKTASFRNTRPESTFNHFVSYNQRLYIGAIDALYQLGADFSRQQTISTGLDECESGVAECPNYNKILLVYIETNTLVVCGSLTGLCQARNLTDISEVFLESEQLVVSPGTLTTEAIIAPGPMLYDVLYVANTYDGIRYNMGNPVYPVSRRNVIPMTDKTANRLIFHLDRLDGDSSGGIPVATAITSSGFIINYKSSFALSEFTYFVQSQVQDLKDDDKNYVSKISRVCHGDDDFESYAEILLRCQGQDPSDNYNLVQAAHVEPAGRNLAKSLGLNETDNVFYGVFAKSKSQEGDVSSNQSALCIFKLSDIEEAFISAIAGCLEDGGDYVLSYLQGGFCPEFGAIDNPRVIAEAQECIPLNWEYADGIDPLISTAVIEWTDILPSSIITTTHRNHTTAFVGTAHGQMVKVHISDDTFAREYERFSVGSPVLRDATLEDNQKEIMILTEQQLLKLQVEKCSAYTTCEECIGSDGGKDGDPYCGWCTLEKRCSRHDDCPMAGVSTRWLSYDSAQCVDISNISPTDRLPITITEQEITLTVQQLPDLINDHTYQCVFDANPPVLTILSGNQLTCQTPPESMIPSIQPGDDHVTMKLSVFSTETDVKFVERDFHFYECNTHKMCVSCTNSSWACDWCIYSNKCTHDNTTCSMDDSNSIIGGINKPEVSPNQGPAGCPQLVVQEGPVLVADGISTEIMVNGINLPDENRASSYMCILEIEGEEAATEANRDGNMLICSTREYSYNTDVQELSVGLSVVWNNDRKLDDVNGFTVTLYKCAVNRPDCSRCLSNITTRSELNCGWCSTNDVCTVQDSSQCSGGWMPSTTNQNCPRPVLMQVRPPSGPVKGNTIITIFGTDLGQKFADIESIKVGSKDCITSGLYENYNAGSSVSCRTMSGTVDFMEAITVTVGGTDGNTQQSTGEVFFTYRNPSISSIEPVEGPEAGGTMVTIRGQYLDAYSHINATIGLAECRMNRMDDVINATTAKCRTTGSPVGSSHQLTLVFDEITEKQSKEVFTYRPNPTVADVQPLTTIQSGGITLTVMGEGFNLSQRPQMAIYINIEEFKEDCEVHNDTMMRCKTPSIQPRASRRKRAVLGQASFGFIIANVSDLRNWSEDNNVTLETYEDPLYMKFDPNPQMKKGDNLLIKGQNLDGGSSREDVTVYIGKEEAYTISITDSVLTVQVPNRDPGGDCVNGNRTNHPCVVVNHGNLEFYIGTLRYPPAEPPPVLAIVVSLACVLLIIILLVVVIMIKRRVKGQKDDLDKLAIKMEELEKDIAEDIREAFAELQTDVTDLTSDLEGTGMPFVPHMQYAASMFFTGLETRPMTYDPELTHNEAEKALLEFSKLISNKQFLIAFIEILDASRSIPNRDKLTIGSLLTINMILENKLPYLTDVLFTKMLKLVEEADEEGKPNKVFQRTETITEKLLSNWIALSLYDFLKDHAAFPLFHLYQAIRCHTEKSPIDAITGKSHVSLNEDNIISERLSFKPLTLNVLVNDDYTNEIKEVKVLDVDSIRQAKGKILDAIYRNKPYSSHAQPWQVDLEWHSGHSSHIILEELDVSSPIQTGWKKINTLKHFNVPDGATVKLTAKLNVPGSNKHSIPGDNDVSQSTSEHQTEEGMQLWHLVKPIDHYSTTVKRRKIDRSSRFVETVRGRKPAMEITFSRILGTKGTLQEYMDGMFAAILNNDNVPVGVKYIFDFFDGLAVKFNIENDAVLHKWKSNILPLRFWQKIITNPQYIFDINQSICVERSLSVISQAFHDAFLRNQEKLSKDASYRKLLYNQEIPQYRKMVEAYYSSISQMQQISKAKLDQDLMEISKKFSGLFSHLSTLLELYKLMIQYKDMLLKSLEEEYHETNLAGKLKQVIEIWDLEEGTSRYTYSQDASEITEDE